MLILLHVMHTLLIHNTLASSPFLHTISCVRVEKFFFVVLKTSDWSNELNLLNLVNLILFGIFQICLGVLTIIKVSDSCLISCSGRFFCFSTPNMYNLNEQKKTFSHLI